MNQNSLIVRANVTLLSRGCGGKDRPVREKYSPNHNFGDADNHTMYIGMFLLSENEMIEPGESKDISINFLNSPGLENLLQIGREWRIQEGNKLVGYGKLLDGPSGT